MSIHAMLSFNASTGLLGWDEYFPSICILHACNDNDLSIFNNTLTILFRVRILFLSPPSLTFAKAPTLATSSGTKTLGSSPRTSATFSKAHRTILVYRSAQPQTVLFPRLQNSTKAETFTSESFRTTAQPSLTLTWNSLSLEAIPL